MSSKRTVATLTHPSPAHVSLPPLRSNLIERGLLKKSPIRKLLAAVSVGVVNGQPLLDLDYLEDKDATVDMNLVMTEDGQFVEVQGSGEEQTFSEAELTAMLGLRRERHSTIDRRPPKLAISPRTPRGLSTRRSHFPIMKKALITGITGQDGSYLAELLLEKGYEVHGIIRRASTFNTGRHRSPLRTTRTSTASGSSCTTAT